MLKMATMEQSLKTPDASVESEADWKLVNENSETMPAAFQARDLSIWCGSKRAVEEVTIDIPSKTITAIIGPSGCGKSTFLDRKSTRLNSSHIPLSRMPS